MTATGLPEFEPDVGFGTRPGQWSHEVLDVLDAHRVSLPPQIREALVALITGRAKIVDITAGPLIETPPLVPPDETSV